MTAATGTKLHVCGVLVFAWQLTNDMASSMVGLVGFWFLFRFLAGNLAASQYVISDASGLGRRYDGIGGLSGGGVSTQRSRLTLVND